MNKNVGLEANVNSNIDIIKRRSSILGSAELLHVTATLHDDSHLSVEISKRSHFRNMSTLTISVTNDRLDGETYLAGRDGVLHIPHSEFHIQIKSKYMQFEIAVDRDRQLPQRLIGAASEAISKKGRDGLKSAMAEFDDLLAETLLAAEKTVKSMVSKDLPLYESLMSQIDAEVWSTYPYTLASTSNLYESITIDTLRRSREAIVGLRI